MHIPTTLKHKPVLVAEDYGRIDGRTASPGATTRSIPRWTASACRGTP